MDHHEGHAGHSHEHRNLPTGRLTAAAGLNVGFAVVQVIVGLALGSVVVLADALHQVVDAVGLVTALVALGLLRRPATNAMSYGWGKADALGGYTSGLMLVASVAWVVYESVGRFFDPVEVSGRGVILIGIAGVLVNGASVVILGEGEELSLRAARLHLLVDLAGSVVVVIAGVLLAGTSLTWIDPAASLLINLLVLHGTWTVLRTAGAELLDRAPSGVDAERIEATIRSMGHVDDVHHVHVRSLAPGRSSVEAHVVVESSTSLHDAQEARTRVQEHLHDQLGIDHSTIQMECHACESASH